MKHSLPSIAALALAATLTCSIRLGAQELYRYPLVGAVTESSATIAVWLTTAGMFAIEYGADPALAGAARTPMQTASAINENVAKAELTGLTPSTRYYYRIINKNATPISAIFSFKTFPEAGRDAPVNILFGSCQQMRPSDSGKVFNVATGLDGDVFLQTGDWTYPDYRIPGFPTEPGTIRESYAMRFDTAYPFNKYILSTMGLAYIWDDHDYYSNNSDGSIPADIKEDVLAAYKRHIPHYPLPNGAGIWQSIRIGNVELFLIDSRSQRKPVEEAFNGSSFAPPQGHSMLAGYAISGENQIDWLMKAIRNSTARWKVLVSPVFFNPGVSPAIPLALLAGRRDVAVEFADKWVGYPADLDSMKKLLSAGLGRNMVVISGDAHTNIYDNGQHSIIPEFMVGNLDQKNSNLFQLMQSYGFNPWTGGQGDSLSTVGRIRVETSPRHRMIVESYDENGLHELSIELMDSSAASVPYSSSSSWKILWAMPVESGSVLRMEMQAPPTGEGRLEIVTMEGRRVADVPVLLKAEKELRLKLPVALPNGNYIGRLLIGSHEADCRFTVVR